CSFTALASGLNASTSHTVCPSAASKQSARSETASAPTSVADVRYSFPRDRTGDDHPLPGIACFQTTCSVAFQLTGTLVAAEIPLPAGPRNSGQPSAAVA